MKVNYWKLHALIATGALAFVVANSIYEAQAGAQPHLNAALQKLTEAISQLDKTKGDVGADHRSKASDATRVAIDEVKAAIAAENEVVTPLPGGRAGKDKGKQ